MKEPRNKFLLASLVLVVFLISGCGALYTGIKTPLPSVSAQLQADKAEKTGKSSCSSYVWLVGVGDCSINAAMKAGNITKVHHVDTEITSILLGLYEKYTIVVYGE